MVQVGDHLHRGHLYLRGGLLFLRLCEPFRLHSKLKETERRYEGDHDHLQSNFDPIHLGRVSLRSWFRSRSFAVGTSIGGESLSSVQDLRPIDLRAKDHLHHHLHWADRLQWRSCGSSRSEDTSNPTFFGWSGWVIPADKRECCSHELRADRRRGEGLCLTFLKQKTEASPVACSPRRRSWVQLWDLSLEDSWDNIVVSAGSKVIHPLPNII